MQNKLFYELSPLIDEINDEYTEFRKKGNSQENAIARIKELYANDTQRQEILIFAS